MNMPAESLQATPTLAALLEGIAAAPPVAIRGIRSDSRRLAAGDVFLACRGARTHALAHLDAARARNLAAIVWDGDGSVTPPAGIPAVIVPDLKAQLGGIANRWFDSPSASVSVTGVTGTNGKTTVAWIAAQCLERIGRRCAYIGTLGAGIETVTDTIGLTTPDCIELHRQLAEFRDAGAACAALEVSSHALSQGRVDGVRFHSALFTNLSRDHIDYHGSMEAYGEAKARLFTVFAPGVQIVCVDSPFGETLAARCPDSVVVASDASREVAGRRYVTATEIAPTATGSSLAVSSSWGRGRVDLPLYGTFNVANALEVLALLLCDGVSLADGLELLGSVTPPPGRMQQVRIDDPGPGVFVDYAHTPAALEAALGALRPHVAGRLWCVFGCGGDRDRGKRPLMGAVVAANADVAVLTSDNPRSEDPVAIMEDVQAGMPGAVTAIADRAAAIAWAIRHASAEDVVLIAGKGHETYQLIGNRRLDFSDYQAALENLRRRAAR